MSKVEKENLVVKHNALINATSKYKYETNELKLICTLISNIDNQKDKGFDIKYMNLRDLNFSEKDITNVEYITNLCESIMSKPFKIGKGVFNWFSGLVYDNGVIEYAFDKRLKPYLLELKDNFTRYNISNILKLRSSYSIQIFELLSQYKTIGTRSITIDEFRKLLKIPKTYKNNDLKRLIEGVQKDLKNNTTLSFEFSFKKLGKSFNSIDFAIKDNYENINKQKKANKTKRLEGAKTLAQRMNALKIEDVEI
ncbi:replication initiation protein [Aliarcobacter cryaerophilus]|uniref:replication initiation protein n=1 Tax=Aliarcobacter cryaerophilus TaxID=28198 RepID=UPI0021B1AB88|nr:replication initiation protein [Aliarcobacter cryaerophilus]MCT7484821.1 replication initiation protein [Aliarcobacter cryaerophilus]